MALRESPGSASSSPCPPSESEKPSTAFGIVQLKTGLVKANVTAITMTAILRVLLSFLSVKSPSRPRRTRGSLAAMRAPHAAGQARRDSSPEKRRFRRSHSHGWASGEELGKNRGGQPCKEEQVKDSESAGGSGCKKHSG